MKTPIQILTERRKEISDQYKRVLDLSPNILSASKKQDGESVDAFKQENKIIRDSIKEQLDQYDEAINILRSVKNGYI